MSSSKEEADALKDQGNAALGQGHMDEALKLYKQAISLDPNNHLLYSNLSAAYCKAAKYADALEQAEKCVDLKPDWAKGYLRKGTALAFLNRHEEAMMAYLEGLNYDPHNQQLKDGAKNSKSKLTGPAGNQPLMDPFGDDDVWKKLEANATTKEYLKDPNFKGIIENIRKNPQSLGQHMQDSRVMTSLGVLLGVDLKVQQEDEEMPQDAMRMPSASSKPQPKPEKPTVNGDSVDEALKAKELGNAAYKKKEFETAIQHYDHAIELDGTNITFRTNKAAVYFEQGNYDDCIKECIKAIETGRENRADYKLIAKALARIGNAYLKQDELENAKTYYNKSLSEHRDPDIVKKVQQVEKTLKERERLAYVDPEKALEEKKIGNEFFTKGKYPEAAQHYTEAIKRNPEDAKLFSNRAACYTKLLEFSLALKDCDECIRLDPTFVKGYLRKGATLVALKEFSKAADVYQKAIDIDANCQEAVEGYRRCMMQENDPEAVKRRAMNDPEVQQILNDPAMQLILQQMQKDPKAIQEHLRNPEVAKKIEKLMEVGLIGFR